MNDYKELCETLRLANSWQFAPKFVDAMLDAADAIEQLVKERNAAVKCIEDIETYLQMGSAKYIDKTIKEWRGVKDE